MTDIAIIGGGLVGLCAGLVVQHPDRRVTIVEAGNFDPKPVQGLAARSIALSISSVQIFRALGLWANRSAASSVIFEFSNNSDWMAVVD